MKKRKWTRTSALAPRGMWRETRTASKVIKYRKTGFVLNIKIVKTDLLSDITFQLVCNLIQFSIEESRVRLVKRNEPTVIISDNKVRVYGSVTNLFHTILLISSFSVVTILLLSFFMEITSSISRFLASSSCLTLENNAKELLSIRHN